MSNTNVLDVVQMLIVQQEDRDKEEEKRRKHDREINKGLLTHMINLKNEMTNEVKEIKSEMHDMKNTVIDAVDIALQSNNQTTKALNTFRNNSRLFQSDENEIYTQAEMKAKKLARDLNYNIYDERYCNLFGAIRRKIFKLISSAYQVNSYKNLTQNQLESVFKFIDNVKLSDLRWSKKQQEQFDL